MSDGESRTPDEASTPQSNDVASGGILYEIVSSPLHLFLVALIAFLVYKIFKQKTEAPMQAAEPEPTLPKMKKRDFTLQELAPYDGKGPDGRILVAVNGKVFDVTKGKRFYGPGGPYGAFGGRDATRGLATFSVTAGPDVYDDLSDLTAMEMDSVKEWEIQFSERYEYVGRLLKPGQQPNSYSDEEEEEVIPEKPKNKDE